MDNLKSQNWIVARLLTQTVGAVGFALSAAVLSMSQAAVAQEDAELAQVTESVQVAPLEVLKTTATSLSTASEDGAVSARGMRSPGGVDEVEAVAKEVVAAESTTELANTAEDVADVAAAEAAASEAASLESLPSETVLEAEALPGTTGETATKSEVSLDNELVLDSETVTEDGAVVDGKDIAENKSIADGEAAGEPVQEPVVQEPVVEVTDVEATELTSDERFATESVEPVADVAERPAAKTAAAGSNIQILTPSLSSVRAKSTNLVIQYDAGLEDVQVMVNNRPIPPETPTQINENAGQVTQAWYDIPLRTGENEISVQGATGEPVSFDLMVEEAETQLAIAPKDDDPRVQADGRSLITLEGQVTDGDGLLIEQDAIVTLTTSAGEFVEADYDPDTPGFQTVARGGEFSTRLQSTIEAQKVKVRAGLSRLKPDTEEPGNWFEPEEDLEAYTQLEFLTDLRPSLVTGSINLRWGARGADYWSSFREFLDPDAEGQEFRARGGLFATGPVGDWLFTGAYNNFRTLGEDCGGGTQLFQNEQYCEERYPVYGDSSTVQDVTPSRDSVYARFERTPNILNAEPDYFMWGDYNTNEFSRSSQLFTAMSRRFHGFKGNYNIGDLQATAFFSSDVEGFKRDIIVPDGTSGYYFLSNRQVIGGSETLYLETEELARPGTVIERRQLFRGTDYEIDEDRGTILFRRPQQATEYDPFGKTLVRRIIASYQFDNDGADTNFYGGRLQYNLGRGIDRDSWIAGSYVQSDQGSQAFDLYGADFQVGLGRGSRLVGEIAQSNHDAQQGKDSGTAYRLEANANINDWMTGRAYYRSATQGFSNDATYSFTPGQTRYGTELDARVAEGTHLTFAYDHEDNFGRSPGLRSNFFDLFDPEPETALGAEVDNSLTEIRAGVRQQLGRADASLEYVNRSRKDREGDSFDSDANQLVSRFNYPFTDKWTFRAQNELNLSGKSDPLYPDRTTLGLDWEAMPGVTLRLAQQFFDGGVFDGDSITSFDTVLDRSLTENANLTGRYTLLGTHNNVLGQGALGLNYGWNVSPGLRLNVGYERIFGDLLNENAAAIDEFAQPYAIGESSSALGLISGNSYNIGLEYTDNSNFQASTRLEHRTSSRGNNTVISASANGKITPSLTGFLRYNQSNASNQLLRGLGDTVNAKLGLAFRDISNDRVNALLRYEYRQNPSTIPDSLLLGSGTGYDAHLFALESLYAPNWQWELYGKYAFRNSNTYLADNFSNRSNISLAQLRLSYQPTYRFDVAGEARWITQHDANYSETGFALEAGYYLTPDLRLAAGYSFGSADDADFTGYRSNGGPYLGLSMKLNRLFNGFGLQKVVPVQQGETLVEETSEEGSLLGNESEPLLESFAPDAAEVKSLMTEPEVNGDAIEASAMEASGIEPSGLEAENLEAKVTEVGRLQSLVPPEDLAIDADAP